MGDVIHTLPAITDAAKHIPEIQVDWVVEKSFSEIPAWHPSVNRVIPVSLRKWRKAPFQTWKSGEFQHAIREIRQEHYDVVLDAQSSIKSAVVSRVGKGKHYGMDRHSARESISALIYQHTYSISKNLHAITRLRQLFSKTLCYQLDENKLDYGLTHSQFISPAVELPKPYLVLIHSASWTTKLWPVTHWRKLIEKVNEANFQVVLPWGNEEEKERSQQIAASFKQITVLPFCTLSQQAFILRHSNGVISVDTGLGHLAAALSVPALSLYGPTDIELIGTRGENQQQIIPEFTCLKCKKRFCAYQDLSDAACLEALEPEEVWSRFVDMRKN
jgi:heptosyltransferase-1